MELIENEFHVPREARRSVHEPDLHDTRRLPSRRVEQPEDREFGRNAECGVQRAVEVRSFLEIIKRIYSCLSQFLGKLTYFGIPDLAKS